MTILYLQHNNTYLIYTQYGSLTLVWQYATYIICTQYGTYAGMTIVTIRYLYNVCTQYGSLTLTWQYATYITCTQYGLLTLAWECSTYNCTGTEENTISCNTAELLTPWQDNTVLINIKTRSPKGLPVNSPWGEVGQKRQFATRWLLLIGFALVH